MILSENRVMTAAITLCLICMNDRNVAWEPARSESDIDYKTPT